MKKISERVVFQGQWLMLKEIKFRGQQQDFYWEMIERVGSYGAVVIIARMLPSQRIILIRQYRPAIDNYVIGFPAGLAESNDIAAEALKELREETGYVGRVIKISPPLKSNPALMNDKVYIVHAEVDERDAANLNPIQSLDPTEVIEVLTVGEDTVTDFLEEQRQKGFEIGIGPWYAFALG